MTDRIRVLQIVQNLNFGGMERLIAEMARRTDARQFESHVMALQYLGHFSKGLDQFAKTHLAGPMPRWSMLRPTSLAQQIREIRPDVVHTHGGVWYKAGLAARMAGVPITIHTDHGRRNPDPWLHRQIDNLASRRTDIVVAVSEALGDKMHQIVAKPSRLRVIANGVDTERYQPRAYDGFLHRELGLAPDTPMLGSVGRLEAIKGYEVMVAAFALFVQRYQGTPRPALVLIGDGRQKVALEQAVTDAGIRDRIYFLGWRSDIEQCLNAFTLFTMSSHSEGTSVSLLEAMSSGLCPIVTDVGGNAAVLSRPLQHRLVPAATPDALATAWLSALADPDLLAADSGVARERILSEFGLDAMVRAYERLYLELYQQQRPAKSVSHMLSVSSQKAHT